MTLHLATQDTKPPLRFHAVGGDLYADGAPITLVEAFVLCRAWLSEALTLGRRGHIAHALQCRQEAYALENAARACIRQRRAAGWSNPLDADGSAA
jgi:hypothetical protein